MHCYKFSVSPLDEQRNRPRFIAFAMDESKKNITNSNKCSIFKMSTSI